MVVDPLDEVVPALRSPKRVNEKLQHSVKSASQGANLTECLRLRTDQRSRALRLASSRAIGTRNGEQDT